MLIGLTGRKQAGKDTVYAHLAHIVGDTVTVERVSFADLLYASAAASLGVTVAQLNVWKADPAYTVRVVYWDGVYRCDVERSTLTVREYLQHYGTEAHRDIFGPDFWVDQVAATLNTHTMSNRLMVVTDVRFENEARMIHDAGGSVVEVIGPMGRHTTDAHASEEPLPEELVDATIENMVRDDGFRSLDRTLGTLLRLHLGGAS